MADTTFEPTVPLDAPPHTRLGLVVGALLDVLPNELALLLASPRFADGALLLRRLGEPARTARALEELHPAEAEMLALLLVSRFADLDGRPLPPAVLLSRSSDTRRALLAHSGLEPGYEVIWEGAAPDGETPGVARITGEGRITARVRGRARRDGQRCILVAQL